MPGASFLLGDILSFIIGLAITLVLCLILGLAVFYFVKGAFGNLTSFNTVQERAASAGRLEGDRLASGIMSGVTT